MLQTNIRHYHFFMLIVMSNLCLGKWNWTYFIKVTSKASTWEPGLK